MLPEERITLTHPEDNELAGFLARSLPKRKMAEVARHISRCEECLAAVVCAYESAGRTGISGRLKDKALNIIRKLNPYLILAVAAFAMSFVMPRHFIQLLVATLLFGTKWVVDSKTTKMLVMIYEAWKKGGEKEASVIMERIGRKDKTLS